MEAKLKRHLTLNNFYLNQSKQQQNINCRMYGKKISQAFIVIFHSNFKIQPDGCYQFVGLRPLFSSQSSKTQIFASFPPRFFLYISKLERSSQTLFVPHCQLYLNNGLAIPTSFYELYKLLIALLSLKLFQDFNEAHDFSHLLRLYWNKSFSSPTVWSLVVSYLFLALKDQMGKYFQLKVNYKMVRIDGFLILMLKNIYCSYSFKIKANFLYIELQIFLVKKVDSSFGLQFYQQYLLSNTYPHICQPQIYKREETMDE